MTYRGRHRADSSESFSVRSNRPQGVPDGNRPETERESDASGFSQSEADHRSADYTDRHAGEK